MHRWQHLIIDVQIEECDPDYRKSFFDAGGQPSTSMIEAFGQNNAKQRIIEIAREKEKVAKEINHFKQQTEEYLEPIGVFFKTDDTRDFGVAITGTPHIVDWKENDKTLAKSRMSVVPESAEAFRVMYQEGTRGFVISGFSATDCILESAHDLIKLGFQVVIPEELIDHTDRDYKDKLKKIGVIVISKEDILSSGGTCLEQYLHQAEKIDLAP